MIFSKVTLIFWGLENAVIFKKRQRMLTGPQSNKNINIFRILKHLDCEVTRALLGAPSALTQM